MSPPVPLRFAASAALLAALLGACSKPSADSSGSAPAASGSAASSGGRTGAASATPSAAPAPTAVAWTGTYTSAPGSLYVHDGGEWKGVHFRGDDASTGLGEGTLALTVDQKTHRVSGEGAGPLGDVVLTGAVTGDELTFSVLRKDGQDRGLTGTGAGKVSEGSLAGTMRLSRGDAHVIREATFSLKKKAP